MPNPQTIDCPADVWTPIALDQIFGYIFKLSKKPSKYLYTYRLAGDPAPANTNVSEGTPIFITDEKKFIIAGIGIDIYVMAVGNDGQVRYDWWW